MASPSAERSTLVTLAFAANALITQRSSTNSISTEMNQTLEGSIGTGNRLGWEQDETSILFKKKTQKHTSASL